ncbi:MAG: polyphosphate polymerase domain-containing protein [Planctomycetaceae bacterium]|nr:polyphosphate polymerase domain-containing protein [Planctomycetaceae bacterium]
MDTSEACTPVFEIVGSQSTRSDLAVRREVKFTLPGADLGRLRDVLDANCRRLIHNDRISTVRSIYFDDVRLSACQANLAGVGKRQKLRLRWYDSLNPGADFFFEIKWRENRITGKHRLQLRAARPLAEMSYRQIMNGLIEALPKQHVGRVLAASEPVAIVEYKREHFASPDGSLRITLDYDLTFYDQTGKRYINKSFPHRLHDLVVVEGKTPVGRERELRAMLYPLALRVGRCSKYVHGCRLLNLIPSAA